LTSERLGFLAALPERPAPRELAELAGDVDLVQKDVPFCLLGIRGDDAVAVGAAIATLTALRLTAACNVCIQDGTAWVLPRRLETPTPHFPYALGAAELWGRWCYVDEAPFAAAGGEDLEQALVRAGAPPP
ncbi:MAG: hypothetical protein KDE27_10280, partial [Planctomycetes bacterium]|nr:hypothetical protein [Planctomycetota bacterium]